MLKTTNHKRNRVRQKLLKRLSLFACCLCLSMANLSAEEALSKSDNVNQEKVRTIKGIVKGHDNEPLIGVTIREKGTSNGAVSDIDGNYSLNLTSANPILEFTYLGYTPKEVAVGNKTVLDVLMSEDTVNLDEYVLVGYAQQRKSSVTGAITSVDADKLKTVSSPDVSAMLQGKVAGVSVGGSNGRPGSTPTITIRGRGSISSTTTPLWVVDGVVGGTTSSLNPNDIESISVLKDGSATALYGSRGANGVILVTTKGAKLGDNRINVSAKLGIVTPQRGKLRMMSSQELYDYTEAAFLNSTNGEIRSWFTPALLENDTDWWDIATQNALSQNYTLSLSMGTEKLRSFLSADFYKEDGTVKGYDYKRYTVRNNNVYNVNERLTLRTKVNGSYGESSDNSSGGVDESNANVNSGRLYNAFTYLPWDTPRNSLGEIKTGKEGQDISTGKPMSDYWFGRDASNYLYDTQMNWSKKKTVGIDGNFGLEFKIIDGLVFESNNNVGFRYSMSDSYTDPKSQSGSSMNGSLYNANTYYNTLFTNQMFKYTKTFDKHDILAYAAYEYNQEFTKTNSATGSGIPVGGEVLGIATTPTAVGGDKYTSKTLSYFFNANYTYDSKYMLQFSIRRDGSSKFGRNKRFGTFATIGGGWNIHEENFMKSAKQVNLLKLRASYGSTGNTPGAAFSHMGLYQINLNYNGAPSAFPYQMANRDMSWEKAISTNVGIDARFFDRLGVSIDLYNKDTSGLLYSQVLSALSGYGSRWINDGSMWNRGFEVTISPEIIKTADFFWGADFNLSYNKNKITALAGGKDQEISGMTMRKVGKALGTYYMKEWAGVNPIDGTPQWFAVDQNGHKYIVSNEAEATKQVLDKNRFPNFQGGIATNFSYKDFTLTANFTFATGFYIYHSGRQNYDNDGIEIQYNSMKMKDGWSRWEKPGDIATHPQVRSGGNNASNVESTRYLEKGDFFKLQSLALNYNVPAKLIRNYGFTSANVTIGAENLFTLTQFSGVDPELGINGSSLGAGYSTPRRVTFSINLGF